jgi:hypothetical protein
MDDYRSPLETNDSSPPTMTNNTELQMEEDRQGSLLLGVIGGALAALLGAIAWALVTVLTGYRIGWVAIGVGFLVGICIRFFGKGHRTAFGILGALFAFLGCFFGNIFSIYGIYSNVFDVSIFEVMSKLSFGMVLELMKESFKVMDLLFYAIAIYEGFRFSVSNK